MVSSSLRRRLKNPRGTAHRGGGGGPAVLGAPIYGGLLIFIFHACSQSSCWFPTSGARTTTGRGRGKNRVEGRGGKNRPRPPCPKTSSGDFRPEVNCGGGGRGGAGALGIWGARRWGPGSRQISGANGGQGAKTSGAGRFSGRSPIFQGVRGGGAGSGRRGGVTAKIPGRRFTIGGRRAFRPAAPYGSKNPRKGWPLFF